MDWKPRVIEPGELDATIDLSSAVFGAGFVAPENYRKEVSAVVEADRCFVVDDADHTIAGTGAAYTFRMTMPGGASVPVCAVTEIGVLPTHRRQGVLTAIMDALFDQAVDLGEPLAALTASEGGIYRRYGFGVGARYHRVLVDTVRSAQLVPVAGPGRLRLVTEEQAVPLLPIAWEGQFQRSPGEMSRNDAWWEMLAIDPEDDRGGASARYLVVHEDTDGEPDGFASYRLKEGGAPDGYFFELSVDDLAAANEQVEAVLVRYLMDVDLVRQFRWRGAPLDWSLPWRLVDPRAVKVVEERDHLWLRPLDVAACLSSRTYAAAGGGVLEVVDERRPEVGGRFALDAGVEGADCARVDVSPDVTLGVAELGALLLGGVTWATLQRAGVLDEHTSGAVDRLDALFRPTRAPHCTTGF